MAKLPTPEGNARTALAVFAHPLILREHRAISRFTARAPATNAHARRGGLGARAQGIGRLSEPPNNQSSAQVCPVACRAATWGLRTGPISTIRSGCRSFCKRGRDRRCAPHQHWHTGADADDQ